MNIMSKLITDVNAVEIEQISLLEYAHIQFRKLCASRGLDFDAMTEMERINFVDDLIHEDRGAAGSHLS